MLKPCKFCGNQHGFRCPDVKAIEYHANGKIRRVEFMTPMDYRPLASTDIPGPFSGPQRFISGGIYSPPITSFTAIYAQGQNGGLDATAPC